MNAAARRHHSPDTGDQVVSLRVDWKTFEAVLPARGDTSVPRLAYLDGVMELMSPAKAHESIAG